MLQNVMEVLQSVRILGAITECYRSIMGHYRTATQRYGSIMAALRKCYKTLRERYGALRSITDRYGVVAERCRHYRRVTEALQSVTGALRSRYGTLRKHYKSITRCCGASLQERHGTITENIDFAHS